MFHLIPVIIGLIGICIGCLLSWIARYYFPFSCFRWGLRITLVLMALAWIAFFGALIYWHFSVEPRINSLVGSGIGFGWVFVHYGGSALALFFSGLAYGFGCQKPGVTKMK